MCLCFIFLIFNGLLARYILLPGFKRNLKYGADYDLYFLGMDRHQWGTIHFIVSLVLILGLLFHFILHWKSIKSKMNRLISKSTFTKITYIVLLILIFSCVFGTFMIKPDVVRREHLELNRNNLNDRIKPNNQETQDLHSEIEIMGSMSLEQAAEKYDVSIEKIVDKLGVNQNESTENIGRLRKKYGFTMNELKELIQKNRHK